jgi:hypothetical protein
VIIKGIELTMKQRDAFSVTVLGFITMGIYSLYWLYVIREELN